MWDCPDCGCQRVAASLIFCPMCFKERSDMPKATVEGGASNASALPDEPGYIAADTPEAPQDEPAAAGAGDAAPEAAEAAPGVPEPPKATPKPAPAKPSPKTAGDGTG